MRQPTTGPPATGEPVPACRDRPLPGSMPPLRSMRLDDVLAACWEETAKRQRGEPFSDAFGLELFRRAVSERDPAAWEGVLAQYRGLVTSWVLRHPAYASGQVDAQDVVVRAFGRLWMAVGPDRLAQFPGLGALLRYLKMCAHSVLLDELSGHGPPRDEAPELEDGDRHSDIEALAIDRLAASQLWDAIARALNDESERLVVHLSFALGLQPGGICERYPGRFASVADVYRIKRNVVDRLRRSDEIRAFLQPGRKASAGAVRTRSPCG